MILPWWDVPLGTGTIRTSLTPAEGQRLHDLAQNCRVLEVGSAYGYSAIRMASMARWVIAVDPHAGELPNSLEVMQRNVADYGHGRVAILRERSEVALPKLAMTGDRFDLVFIDGDHSAEAVTRDVLNARGMLADGGVLVCHDHGEASCPGVAVALDGLYPEGPDELVDTLWVKRIAT